MEIDTTLPSVVAVRAHIPEDAFTASGLGTLREGSGVVIDDGLVLTIGYLITEAEEVWLTTHDNRVVAAHPLAYDQETGFGLVQALGDLNLPALELGDSSVAKLGDTVLFADGTGNSVKAAIVGKQEFAGYWEYLLDEAIFIAPAHPSWGGAALLDTEGKLIGIGSLRLQMMQNGKVVQWGVEGPSAASLARQGVAPKTFPEGTIFTVRLYPLRDGRPFGALAGLLISCGATMPAMPLPASRTTLNGSMMAGSMNDRTCRT